MINEFICFSYKILDFFVGMVIRRKLIVFFVDWQGNPWDWKSIHLLISKPEIHQELVDLIGDIQY